MPYFGPNPGLGQTVSRWNNFAENTGAAIQTTNLTGSTRSLFVFPLDAGNEMFPAWITASTARMLLSISGSTASMSQSHSVGFSLGIYVISGSASASTLSLVNSVGSTWAKNTAATSAAANSYNGIRWLEFASSQWSSQPVFSQGAKYYGAMIFSWSSISFNTLAQYGGSVMSTFNASGTINAASATATSRGFIPYAGVYTATTAAFPASIHISQLNKQAGNANFVPFIQFDMLLSQQ